jgi:hypothetical protein
VHDAAGNRWSAHGQRIAEEPRRLLNSKSLRSPPIRSRRHGRHPNRLRPRLSRPDRPHSLAHSPQILLIWPFSSIGDAALSRPVVGFYRCSYKAFEDPPDAVSSACADSSYRTASAFVRRQFIGDRIL